VPAARLIRAMPTAPGIAEADGRLPVLVELPAGVSAADVGVFPMLRGFGSARLTPSEVLALDDAFPGLHVFTGPPKQPLMDQASSFARATSYREQTGLAGRGVVMGVVDTGIDITHPGFLDADGKSRIAWLLTLGLPRGVHADIESRLGCDRIDVGTCAVWSGSELDEVMAAGDIPTELRDFSGHGTHVAGIAAGNGRSRGTQGTAETKYVGMAPEATLVVAASGSLGGFSDPNILRGTTFVFDRADSMALPAVANLSLGGDFGSHDGTSVLEKALASLVGDDHPGRAIVISAGNSGGLIPIEGDDTGIHTEVRVRPSSAVRVPFIASAPAGGGVFIWVTMREGDEVAVGVEGKDGETWVDPVEPGDEAGYEGDDGSKVGVINNVVDTRSDLTADSNGAVIAIQGKFAAKGVELAVTLEGEGDAQLWIAPSGFSFGLFRRGLTEGTISVPATHPRLLAVGSSISRVEWDDIAGNTLSAGALGEADLDGISDFSSCGPTATGVPKPEIVAPGQFIASAMSADADPAVFSSGIFSATCPSDSPSCLVVDEAYALSAGTSMSSPVVAGAIALLFGKDATLTQGRVTELLQTGARRLQGPVGVETQAGPGSLDMLGSLAALAAEDAEAGSPPDVAASWWTLSASYARPDPTWPLEGVVQLRRGDGTLASGLDGSLLSLEVDNGSVQKQLTKVNHGTFGFTVSGRRGTAGTDMRVRVLYDGVPIGEERILAIGGDRFSADQDPSAVGGCAVGGSNLARPSRASTSLGPSLGAMLIAALALALRARGASNRHTLRAGPPRR